MSRRIVTGVNEVGRSYVVSNEELPAEQRITVWDYDPADQLAGWIAAIDPGSAADWIGPDTAGGARFIYADFPPKSEQQPHPPMPQMDENGMHTTRTIDFDYVVRGCLTLVLEEETVDVEQGDFVVLQAGKHSWRNDTESLATLVVLVFRPLTAT